MPFHLGAAARANHRTSIPPVVRTAGEPNFQTVKWTAVRWSGR